MTWTLELARREGHIHPLQLEFVSLLKRRLGEDDDGVLLGAALASLAPSQSHVSLDLADPPSWEPRRSWPDAKLWKEALARSGCVGEAGCTDRPLILEGSHLYLQRYHAYQQALIHGLVGRARHPSALGDDGQIETVVQRRFGQGDDPHQAAAAAVAARSSLTLMVGGPGRGKTYTVARILAVLCDLRAQGGRPLPMVSLLAPTGKAADRLGTSVQQQLGQLKDVGLDLGSLQASTLHRALGYQPRQPTRFRHNRDRPLGADVVVVDEVSMVDLPMMAKLLEALRDDARLILVGDSEQLLSVEAGAVLADIVGAASGTELEGCVVELTHNHRSEGGGAIELLASSIRDGKVEGALRVLEDPEQSAVVLRAPEGRSLPEDLMELLLEHHRALLKLDDPGMALAHLERFRLLCARRHGPLSVTHFNRRVQEILESTGSGAVDLPFLITQNDSSLGLFNGDVGLLRSEGGGRRAWLYDGRGGGAPDSGDGALGSEGGSGAALRSMMEAELPAHEPLFATTVHKSQGSEYEHVLVVLPPMEEGQPSPLLTRQLLYTGVTRARSKLTLVADRDTLTHCIQNKVRRHSGLTAALGEALQAGQ